MKNLYKAPLIFIITIIASVFMITCSEESPMESQETSKVQGQVTDEEGSEGLGKTAAGVEGAVVTMARVKADGSMETVSTDTVTTDASGNFVVETDVEGETNLVVIAEKNDTTWKAVVSGEVQSGETTQCAPLNSETTVEAEVYARYKADGETSADSYTDIQANINSSAAVEIRGDTDAYADVAAAIRSKMEAKEQMLMDTYGATQANLEAAAEAKAAAQAQLEADLAAAGSASAAEQAHQAFIEAYHQAYLDNNVSANAHASSSESSSNLLVDVVADINSSTEFAFAQKTSANNALAFQQSLQSELEAAGASQADVDAMADVAAGLQADIQAAATLQEINEAFVAFHDSVVVRLHESSSLNLDEQLVTTIDTEINAASGALATLEAALSAAISIGVDISIDLSGVVDAYAAFFSDVQTLAENTLTTASDAEVQAVANIMILANISTI